MLFSDAVRDYLGYIKHERGLIVTYTSWLHHFEKWLPENGYPEPDYTEQIEADRKRKREYDRERYKNDPKFP